MKVKAEIMNCPKCVAISYSKAYRWGVHKMECPKCNHTWNYVPFRGE